MDDAMVDNERVNLFVLLNIRVQGGIRVHFLLVYTLVNL